MTKPDAQLISRPCPICAGNGHDKLLYEANFSLDDLNPRVFPARRLPDRVHYRMVTCQNCGLIRANPVATENLVADLYKKSYFTYAQQSSYAAKTYYEYLTKNMNGLARTISILEIGCGDGAFLSYLNDHGYEHIQGIEPSLEAVQNAGNVREIIRNAMFEDGIFPDASFDAVCAFQVFDHVLDPCQFLKSCHKILKNDGKLFLILHDAQAILNRVLKNASPIVDIEHPFLYSRTTIKKILEKSGFHLEKSFGIFNCYPLRYWLKLMPAPSGLKKQTGWLMDILNLSNIPLKMGLGNMGIVASKQ